MQFTGYIFLFYYFDTDIDECAMGTDNCADNATCMNTPGSFSCMCIADYTGDGISCEPCSEVDGYTPNCTGKKICIFLTFKTFIALCI